MIHAASPDTWAGILLDGLGGALIGAAATIAVVVATIKSERRAREDQRLHDAISQAHASTQAFGFMTHTQKDLSAPDAFAALNAMLQSLVSAMNMAQAYEPKLARLLETTSLELSSVTSTFDGSTTAHDNLRQRVLEMQVVLGRWISSPDKIRDGSIDQGKIRELAASPVSDTTQQTQQPLQPTGWWHRLTHRR